MDDELKNLKINAGLHRRAKAFALADMVSLQELTERALEREIGGKPPEPILAGLSAADRALVTRVAELARSKGSAERIKIIRLVANMPLPDEIE